MDAVEKGAKQGEWFRLHSSVVFEHITREQYRKFGRMKAAQLYATKAKQDQFMRGWFAINQRFFCFLADGPKRRIISATITILCDVCGTEEIIEVEGEDVNLSRLAGEKRKVCSVCEEAS